jgi:hypothetical protein
MLAFADGAVGFHFSEILIVAVPVLIVLGVVAFVHGVRRGLRRD